MSASPRPVHRSRPASELQGRIVFVGGAPRSGTTLVQNMLDSHPEVLGGPEFLHIPDIVDLRQKLRRSVSRGWISLICSADDVDTHIRALVGNLLLPFADRHTGTLLSEKTPHNALVFPQLVELFPGSKFVHVVRDPRATVASLLAVGSRARAKGECPEPFCANVQSAIRHVRRCLDIAFEATRAAPASFHTVVYERLVTNPEREGRALCRFLGIDWSDEMAKPGERNHLGEAAITVNSNEVWYDSASYRSNPTTRRLSKWRTELPAYQQVMINRAFRDRDDLTQLGYRFSNGALSTASVAYGLSVCAVAEIRRGLTARLRRLLESSLAQ